MTYRNTLLKTFSVLLTFLIPTSLPATKTVAITQIVDHPSLNAIREGIIEGLAGEGFVQGENLNILYESAQGNPATAAQIAQKFAGQKVDVIVPISTPSAQPVVKQIKDTPIVFAAISDPLAARVVRSLEKPEGNVTGVADIPPLEEQLKYIENCLPGLKTLGVIYNPGEANNVSFLLTLKDLAAKRNIKILTAAAPKSADVQMAAQSLVSKVDAFFIGNDNTVVSGLEPLIKIALESKKPLFMSDHESVDRGAFAAYAYDQKAMGQQVGVMVSKILKGRSPQDIPVERPMELKLSMNPQTAEKLQVSCIHSNPSIKE